MSLIYNGTNITSIKYNGVQLTKLIYNGVVVWPTSVNYLCFTANTAGSTVSMSAAGSAPSVSLQYSTNAENGDNATWNTFTVGSTTVTLSNIGDKVWFRGNNTKLGSSSSDYNYFVMTGSLAASGDTTYLLSTSGNVQDLSSYGTYTFESLFLDCDSLTTAPELPSTTLASYCYHRMFQSCDNMITAPALPAMNLATHCYRSMLKGTAITVPPVLPALIMQEGCYCATFESCTKLTSVVAVPATTLAADCYQNMFKSCTGIKMSSSRTGAYTNTYTFGATPSSDYAYYMFGGTGGSFTGTPTAKTYYTSNPIVS